MFEEVPAESRGIARLLARPVVLGPFVVGSGMLVAALGGSVAVATAATVITASAIGSADLPARPGHAVTPAASASSHSHSASITRSTAHRTVTAPSASPRPSALPSVGTGQPGASVPVGKSTSRPSHQVLAGPPAATSRPSATPSSPSVSVPSSAVASPSGSGPVGNALVYFTGYDPASRRVAYRFASREVTAPGAAPRYRVSDPQTFTATLANSATITSGGTVCLPAGSTCTADQLLNAVESGFFAEVAIDADGALRSVIEVGAQPAAAKTAAVPSTSPSLDSSPLEPRGNGRVARPGDRSPTPQASPTTTS